MNNQQTSFAETENNLCMVFSINIPKKVVYESECPSLEEHKEMSRTRMRDCIEAFSLIIRESVERRMQACQRLLLNHLDDIVYNDGRHILWKKGGRSGCFNVPAFEAMQQIIINLSHYRFLEVIGSSLMVDQILKALLNDTEPISHEDRKEFRFSELISILMEAHSQPLVSK